jgi:hypothetical protein
MGLSLRRSRHQMTNQAEHQEMETTSHHHHHLEHQACLLALAAVGMIRRISTTPEVEEEVEVQTVTQEPELGMAAVAALLDLKKRKSLPLTVFLMMLLFMNAGE